MQNDENNNKKRDFSKHKLTTNNNSTLQQKQQINELRNQIALMKRENDSLKRSNKSLINNSTKRTSNKKNNNNYYKNKSIDNNNNNNNKKIFNDYDDYKHYENRILNQMANNEIYDDVGSTKDILGEFVDRVLERSLYIYRNKNCHTCARLLAMGKSAAQCPKCHHLYKYPMNSRTNV